MANRAALLLRHLDRILENILENEATRKLFHHKGLIEFFIALGFAFIGLAVGIQNFSEIELAWPFFFAHLSFVAACVWSIGKWLTSNSLRKMNPEKWSDRRRKRATRQEWIKFFGAKWGRSIALTIPLVIAIIFTSRLKTVLDLNRLSNWLVPANDPLPTTTCSKVPKGAFLFLVGSNVVYTFAKFPVAVVAVEDKPKVIFERNDAGKIAVSFDLYDKSGNIVAEIKRNKFIINSNNYYQMKRDNKSTLIIANQQNAEALSIKYLNASAVKLNGLFYFPEINYALEINDNVVYGRIIDKTKHAGKRSHQSTDPKESFSGIVIDPAMDNTQVAENCIDATLLGATLPATLAVIQLDRRP